jgi:hypothetical protein
LIDHFKELKIKHEQMEQYTEFLEEVEMQRLEDISSLNRALSEYYTNKSFTEKFQRATLKIFVANLPVYKLRDALAISASRFPQEPESACRYFCGICWNWIKKPESRNW